MHRMCGVKKLGVFLGHARLSILDLSPSGAQPFKSNSEDILYHSMEKFIILMN